MCRKIICTMVVVMFFVTLTTPVSGHNGVIVIPNQFDPGGEEHPWGGGEQAVNDPVSPFLFLNSITPITTNLFIDITINSTWNTFKRDVRKFITDDERIRKSMIIKQELTDVKSR